ncbi:MAG: DUF4031 domain-containing protein [Phycisphaerales bacterium]|nr:DUF4031 domain-containing protein [Phycisphaerales bacterium]
MAVYVDPLMVSMKNRRWRWPKACHLFADTEVELHMFASMLRLRRGWFQNKRPWFPHYDLTERKRGEAVDRGAIELTREQAVQRFEQMKGTWLRRQRVAKEPV